MTPERKNEVMQINRLHHQICRLSSEEYDKKMTPALKAACKRLSLPPNRYNEERLLDEATVFYRHVIKDDNPEHPKQFHKNRRYE